jgi:outer membrane beta-barrel protein
MKKFFMAAILLLLTASVYGETKLKESLDRIWDDDKRVKVIQERIFEKVRKHEITIFSGVIPDDDYYLYFPCGMKYNYFFTETIGAEIFGAYLFNRDSGIRKALGKDKELHNKSQMLEWYSGLNFLWIPVHGKLSLLGSSLAHFDIGLNTGFGILRSSTLAEALPGMEKTKYDLFCDAGLNTFLYLSQLFALRFDIRTFFYNAYGGNIEIPIELTLGFSIFLGGD